MSLVNDMLRDLEARRAGASGHPLLDDIHAVDEAGAARRGRAARLRRQLLPLTAVILIGIALGLVIEYLARPAAVPEHAETAAAQPRAPVQLLDILPQNDGQRFVLQLLLDRSLGYQRVDEAGAVTLHLKSVQLAGEPRDGRIDTKGRSLSWRVEQHGEEVQVLLVGLGAQLEVDDRLEAAGSRWQLWLEVPLNSPGGEPGNDLHELPVAEPALQATLPTWATDSVPPAALAEPAVAPPPAAKPAMPVPSAPAEMQIASHRVDPFASARQALVDQQYPRAIAELQALHKAQPDNADITRWLARAYLAAGETAALLGWLPAQLQLRPFDAELRMLLARAQLSSGDGPGAVATLTAYPPTLQMEPEYHALLAAVHQQLEEWSASAAIYRQLVALRPQQAIWQLGLAIALEQLDQSAVAARHYQLALRGQGLDAAARQFASERSRALGDRQ